MTDGKPLGFIIAREHLTEDQVDELVDAVNASESFRAEHDETIGTLDIILTDCNDTSSEEVGC